MSIKNIKSKIAGLLLGAVVLGVPTGCNDWLDIDPTGVQTSKTFWQTKEEVEGVLTASYLQLRSSMHYMLLWGELLGNGMVFGNDHLGNQGSQEEAERMLKELNLMPDNQLCNYSNLYKGIGYANAVIKFGPTALKYDVTLNEPLLNSYIAEAVFVRSLFYFYLVRTFKDVPFVRDPYSDDSMEFAIEKTDGDVILREILKDLETYVYKCKPGYETPWMSKGRATSWAFWALMADINLWLEDYEKAIACCDMIDTGAFELVENKEWISIYYPGNSVESIFELQYDHKIANQRNNLYSWFWGGNGRYVVSDYTRDMFASLGQGEIDVRGLNQGYTDDVRKLWKWGGTKNYEGGTNKGATRGDNERSPNFVFYRYADILFIRAEAMIMQGEGNYVAACELLDNTIRKRAGIKTKLSVPTNELDAINMIADERLKEFIGEGRTWYTILRLAKRDNYKYLRFMKEKVLPYVPAKKRPIKNFELDNPYSHYLPIHENEIRAGKGILTQNPFYKKYSDDIK
ncbi:MAG: RagB/SusD family nutrient uptake outer membrane protein [Marinifilaceae bacterium]